LHDAASKQVISNGVVAYMGTRQKGERAIAYLKFLAVRKMSANLLRVGKFMSKNAKFGIENQKQSLRKTSKF